MPEGATADPGSALTQLGMAHAQTLLGMLQSAGGNAEVAELTSLESGRQVAAQAKTDKENVDTMTDGQKVEKFGPPDGGGGGGAPPAPEGSPPAGVADPGAVQGFHAQRASQLAALSMQHLTVAGQLMAAAAMPGISPDMIGFLSQGAAQNQAQAASLAQLQQTYLMVTGELGGSEFIGAAMPGADIPVLYEQRAAGIQAQVTALDAMTAEYAAALAAEQAKIAGCDAEVGALQQQISEAAAAKSEKKEGGAEAKLQQKAVSGGESAKPASPSTSKTSGASAKGAEGGKTSGASSAPTSKQAEGATAKAATPAAPTTSAKTADPIPGLMAQIEQVKARRTSIQTTIRSNEGLVSTMKTYRDLMNSLLTAYQTVLGIVPPQGGGGGGGG